MLSRIPVLLTALPVALVSSLVVLPAAAQEFQQAQPRQLTLRHVDRDMRSFVRPPAPAPERRGPGTTINVTYNGFPPGAQTAFQFAVDIWEALINSTVPIEVDATWTPLALGVLGSAGPAHAWSGGSLPANIVFPDALADSLVGFDICSVAGCAGEPDINARFSSTFSWYLGTDGNTPGGQVDFVSVVLHELGHGLGFSGGMLYDDGVMDMDNPIECNNVAGTGCRLNPDPAIYDVSVDSPLGTPITNYATPSAALGTALTNDQVYWVGTEGVAGNSGAAVRLYAPGTWDQGSSYSHLNETTFVAGNINSLMTPFLGNAEAIHTPGPITLGMFEDMLWSVNVLTDIFSDGFETGNTTAWSSTVP